MSTIRKKKDDIIGIGQVYIEALMNGVVLGYPAQDPEDEDGYIWDHGRLPETGNEDPELAQWLRALEKVFELTDPTATINQNVIDSQYDEATVSQLSGLYPRWESGIAVEVGDLYRWDGTVVEVVQAHTTQADWTPDRTPALWKVHRTDEPGDDLVWIPNISVEVDEVFEYEGAYYKVIQAHTTQEGWEPPETPALWELVTPAPEEPEDPDPEDPDPEDPPEEPEGEGYPEWEPWTSGLNEDLYQVGDRVSHNGSDWEATAGDNHWEPGVFGWVEI